MYTVFSQCSRNRFTSSFGLVVLTMLSLNLVQFRSAVLSQFAFLSDGFQHNVPDDQLD